MTEPSDTAGCSVCNRNAAQLAALQTGGWWECSHVACPGRKPITAAPPQDGTEAMGRDGSGCWRMKPVFQE